MKHEATLLAEAQQYEICVFMLEDINEVLEMMRIEEEPPIDDGIQPIKTFAKSKSVADFKGFEALYNTTLDINDQLLCSHVQTEVGEMYDELQ